jgi:hypothetical protein
MSQGRLDDGRVTAWWFAQQGLEARRKKSPVSVLSTSGWVHTAGGQGPYLSLLARAGLQRAEVDASIASGEMAEVPSVRGCTMLVPAQDVALSLCAARAPHETRLQGVRAQCDWGGRELYRLCETVLRALGRDSLLPEELAARVGPKAIRNLGEQGKKLGFATTLPIALAELQVRGQVRRLSVDGRLDSPRFRYRVWSKSPLGAASPSDPELQLELARRFFDWAGPATRDELAFWLGAGKKQAAAIIEELELDRVGDRLIAPRYAARLLEQPNVSGLRLLPFRDNLFAFRRGIAVFVDDPATKLLDWGKGTTTAGKAASLHQHAIVDGGRLIGVWDWDSSTQKIAWVTFQKPSTADRRALNAIVGDLQAMIGAELGDPKFYSLDNESNRKSRLSFIRSLSSKRA